MPKVEPVHRATIQWEAAVLRCRPAITAISLDQDRMGNLGLRRSIIQRHMEPLP